MTGRERSGRTDTTEYNRAAAEGASPRGPSAVRVVARGKLAAERRGRARREVLPEGVVVDGRELVAEDRLRQVVRPQLQTKVDAYKYGFCPTQFHSIPFSSICLRIYIYLYLPTYLFVYVSSSI